MRLGIFQKIGLDFPFRGIGSFASWLPCIAARQPSSHAVDLSFRVSQATDRTVSVGFSPFGLILSDEPIRFSQVALHITVLWTAMCPLMDLTPLQSVTRGELPFSRRPLMRFVAPPTLEEVGSDLHQVSLTWLCCTFRFSQPPGALFLPRPAQLCFTLVAPMGFFLQRFVPLIRPEIPSSISCPS
jgi:hypothetical protein